MKSIERLFIYFDKKQIKPTAFEKKIGLSNGYLGTQKKRNADIGESVLINILNNCLDLDPNWLIFGEGEMLRSENTQENSQEVAALKTEISELKDQLLKSKDEIISLKDTIIKTHTVEPKKPSNKTVRSAC